MHAYAPGGFQARESWFDLLDQRRFVVGGQHWTAQVAGVHVAGLDVWVQIEFEEDRRRSVLLRLTPDTGIAGAIEAIQRLLVKRVQSN